MLPLCNQAGAPFEFESVDAARAWLSCMHLFERPWVVPNPPGQDSGILKRTWAHCKLCPGEWNMPRTLASLKQHASSKHRGHAEAVIVIWVAIGLQLNCYDCNFVDLNCNLVVIKTRMFQINGIATVFSIPACIVILEGSLV